MQSWHWVEKLMSMSYAMLTLSWKVYFNKNGEVENVVSISNVNELS